MDFNEVAKEIHKTAVEKGWWEDPDRNFGETLLLVVSEACEAFEEYRDGKDFNEIYIKHDNNGFPKPEGIPIELADIIIRVADLCVQKGIDLEQAVALKMGYNKIRPYRHGGKLA